MIVTEVLASDDYVAWLRWSGDSEHRHLVVCDSDAPGAFKVYRRAVSGGRGMSKLDALDKILLDSVLEDLARMMNEKNVIDYVWIGKAGEREYKMRIHGYDKNPNDKDS